MTLFLIGAAAACLLFGVVPWAVGRLAVAIGRIVYRLMRPPD